MKVFGTQVFDTSRIDGLGFNRSRIEKAVRDYLDTYKQVNNDYPVGRSTMGPLDAQTSQPVPDTGSIAVPLSSPNSPLSPMVVRPYTEDNPSHGLDNCRNPTDSETSVIGQVMNTINAQLRDWGMPNIQFENHLPEGQAPTPASQNASKTKIDISACGKGSDQATGYMETHRDIYTFGEKTYQVIPNPAIVLSRKDNFFKRPSFRHLVAHELAHIVGTHPQHTVNLDTLNPDLLQYMCEQPGHQQLGSVLIYQEECLLRGYDADMITPNLTGAKFGDLELAHMTRYNGNTDTERRQNFEVAINRVVDGIRNNYGQKVASHAVAALCATTLNRVLHHSIDTSRITPANKQTLHQAANLLSNLLRLAVLTQMVGFYSLAITAVGVPLAGGVSNTVKSVARLLSAAGLGLVMLSAIRGNSDALFSLMACVGGQTVGVLLAEIINSMCACGPSHPSEYVDRVTHRNAEMSNWIDKVEQRMRGVAPQKVSDAVATLAAMDKKLAQAVDRYARLGFLYDLLPTPEAGANAITAANTAAVANIDEHVAQAFPIGPPQVLSTEQAIELAVSGITEHEQLQILEEGRAAHQSI